MSLFSGAHDAFRERLRRFVEVNLTPNADEWEQRAVLPASVFEDLAREGFLGMTRDPRYGGQGLDFAYDVVLAEELPRSRMMGLTLRSSRPRFGA
jgi:alkylation response protein AidB-like acyl-CoA dehydrogenase